MNEQWVPVIAAIIGLLSTTVGFVFKIYQDQREMRHVMNSRLDELVASTRALAHAQGVAEEKERAGTATALHTEAVAEGVAQERASPSDAKP